MSRRTQAAFIQGAMTLVDNAAGDPVIAKKLAEYGYTEARMKEGSALIKAADEHSKMNSAEQGEKAEASSEFADAWAKANRAYSKTLKIARIALGDDEKNAKALKLSGSRKQSFVGWFDQAGTFYDNALKDERVVASLGRFGYTAETLGKERAYVQDALSRYQAQAMESGSARESTIVKNKKLDDADDWISDFRAVLEVAFYDEPEQLLKLGPMSPVCRRKK